MVKTMETQELIPPQKKVDPQSCEENAEDSQT